MASNERRQLLGVFDPLNIDVLNTQIEHFHEDIAYTRESPVIAEGMLQAPASSEFSAVSLLQRGSSTQHAGEHPRASLLGRCTMSATERSPTRNSMHHVGGTSRASTLGAHTMPDIQNASTLQRGTCTYSSSAFAGTYLLESQTMPYTSESSRASGASELQRGRSTHHAVSQRIDSGLTLSALQAGPARNDDRRSIPSLKEIFSIYLCLASLYQSMTSLSAS